MTDLAIAAPPAKPAPITAADVNACIQGHFGSGGGQYAVLFEVRNGTAWRANRSVDAVVMSLWPSLGMELWGMEVKVSRGDWLREVRDPKKASEVFAYFDRWFLIAPDHVVKPGELPEPWGWFVPENGRLRKVRDATKNQEVKGVDRHFLGALLRRTAKTDDAFVESRIATALADQRRRHEAEIDQRALQRQGDLRADAEQWAAVRQLLKNKPEDWISQADTIAAIKIVMKSGVANTWGGLRSLMSATDRLKSELAKIADELGVETEDAPKRRKSR